MIVLSGAITLATFCVLIETWRRIIVAWGERITFGDAARIFFVSSLVRYVPGSTAVQIPAMAELSRRRNVSPAAAAGASLINVAVNIATGFIVALTAGFRALDVMSHGHARLGIALAALMLAGILALPALLPHMVGLVKAATGRELGVGRLPISAIYIALVGNLLAWAMYGLSYQALVGGVIGQAPGSSGEYIAVYAGAYVLGYLVFFLPAGAGVRETVQINFLTMLALATPPQAAVVAVSARLLTTVLEIVPGLFFLSRGTRTRPQDPTERNGQKP